MVIEVKAMPLKVLQAGNVVVIHPTGELHHESAQPIIAAVKTVLEKNIEAVVLSLASTTAVLGDGIRTLVRLRDSATEAGKILHITNASPEVIFPIRLAGLLEFLNHVETLPEILEPYGVCLTDLKPMKRMTEAKAAPPSRPDKADASRASSPEPAPKKDSTPEKLELDDEGMLKVISRYLPNRLAFDIVKFFQRNHKSVVEAADIATATGEKEKVVKKMLAEMVSRGVLKSMGADLYNYAPEHQINEQVLYVFEKYANPGTHGKILSLLLKAGR